MAKSKPVAGPVVMTHEQWVAFAAQQGIQLTGAPVAPAVRELPARVWAEVPPKRNASDAGYPMAGIGSSTRHGMAFALSIPQDAVLFIWNEGKAGRPLTFPRNPDDKGK